MQYTQLGERGPRVSRIAFGNWSAGGDWGRVDRDAAIAATREALDLGITLFDTARAYGFGAAEELLGEALRPEIQSARDVDRHRDQGRPAQGRRRPVRDSSPAALRRDLEASLALLGTDYVDIYQVHWPDPGDADRRRPPRRSTASSARARSATSACRTTTPRQMTTFQQVRPIDTLQPPYHLFRRDIETIDPARSPGSTASASSSTARWPTACSPVG